MLQEDNADDIKAITVTTSIYLAIFLAIRLRRRHVSLCEFRHE